MADIPTSGEKLVNSVILTLIARGAMIFATLIGLPTAAWMIQRGVAGVDQISQKIDSVRDQVLETGSAVRLIQQTQGNQTQIIADHESRVRTLEAINRSRPAGLP